MSHIDISPVSLSSTPEIEISSPDLVVADAQQQKSFARGLMLGLVLGVSCWVVMIAVIWLH